MRTIGIDLSTKGEHKAVVVDERGHFVSPILHFRTDPASLMRLLEVAQEGNPDRQLQEVMEPTGMAWFPVAVFLIRQGEIVYLVNSQQVADLRRYYKKHAKSDRVDARVLAKLPIVDEEKLHRLELSDPEALACQRGCKQLDRLMKQHTACKNRLIALDRFAWPGLEDTVFSDPFSPAAFWFRQNYYDPLQVHQAGAETIHQEWLESGLDSQDSGGLDRLFGPVGRENALHLWPRRRLSGLRTAAGRGRPRAGVSDLHRQDAPLLAAQDCPSTLSAASPQPQPGDHSRGRPGWYRGLHQFHRQPRAREPYTINRLTGATFNRRRLTLRAILTSIRESISTLYSNQGPPKYSNLDCPHTLLPNLGLMFTNLKSARLG